MVAYHSEVGRSEMLAAALVLVQIPPVCCTRTAAGPRGKRPRPSGRSFVIRFLCGRELGSVGVGERWGTDREVIGKMTLTPGIWRQVAEEEESWTATSKRNTCR